MWKLVFVILVSTCSLCLAAEHKLKEKFRWKTLDYQFNDAETRSRALRSGEYIPQNNVPYGVQVWRDKVFVTVPRRNPGIPSTLNYISLDSNTMSPPLKPFPDWSSNQLSSRFLVSIFRVHADSCDRLWTIDNGAAANALGAREVISPPRIRVFDLRTDALLLDYALQRDDYVCDSLLSDIVVDVGGGGAACDDAFAYVTDTGAGAMVVYSLRANSSWPIRHPYFLPHPLHSDYTLAQPQLHFQWTDGLLGLALSEPNKFGHRKAFMHATSSLFEIESSTQWLRNRSTSALASGSRSGGAFRIIGSRGDTFQAANSAYCENYGVLFYSLVSKNAIGCWNSRKYAHYAHDVIDIVAADDQTMIYSSDLKADKATSTLWAMSNRLPLILAGRIDADDYNFRILSARVADLIKDTLCDPGRHHH